MPKKSGKSSWGGRGSGRRAPPMPEELHFYGHDDRTAGDSPTKTKSSGGNRPRVSFKNQTFKYSMQGTDRDRRRNVKAALQRLLDDDSPMSGGTTNNNNVRDVPLQQGRSRGIPRGRNSPLSHRGTARSRNHESKRSLLGNTVWHTGTKSPNSYRITIPSANKEDRKYLIDTLLGSIAPDTFVPIMYRTGERGGAVFYVDEQKIAKKLQDCSWKVTNTEGYKIHIGVEPGFPQYNIDQEMKDRMKQAMAKRYVQETNALDLSRFHLDPELVDDYYCALTRPTILIAALDIVASVIPNLKALNLDHNNLHSFDKLHLLSKKLSSLKILYLGDNKIKDMQQINAIKGLKLEELRLAGNPLCEKYKERQDDYVSDIRHKFPELQRLDGAELPATIGFDLANDKVNLPATQRLFAPNPKAQAIASEFLQQYFRIYDSGNRQPLLDAYHEQACFSLTVALTYNSNKFSSYINENRNLCKVTDVTRRRKLLKQGRLPVVSYISELPATRHDLTSFTMDIGLVTEGMMMITVSGLFKEIETKEAVLRYFSRTFTIVPEGSGYCISNEMLHIRRPTDRQEKQAQQFLQESSEPQIAPAPASTSASVEPAMVAAPGAIPVTAPISDDVRTQMTLALSERTNMNLQWSLKCLEEVKWDFMTALAAFHDFHTRGQIPPDAFNK